MTTTVGTCYVCATPIGNLKDCTFRLVDTLNRIGIIAAEDTRVSQKLLSHLNVQKPLITLQQHNESKQAQKLLAHLTQGQHVALLSDAGTPNICDPGARLIHILRQHHIPIVPIPGPSAITTLLSVSGLLANGFYFGGFFPRTLTEVHATLKSLIPLQQPLVFFETAKRLQTTLDRLSAYPEPHIVIGKELTKHFETILSGPLTNVQSQLNDVPIKGEFCFIITFQSSQHIHNTHDEWIHLFKDTKLTVKQSLSIGEKLGIPKNKIKQAFYND